MELVTTGPNPHVTFKLHKSWSGEGDYLPYYIVLDTFPFGPSKAMGVPYVPKHQFLAGAAVPLIQFLPSCADTAKLSADTVPMETACWVADPSAVRSASRPTSCPRTTTAPCGTSDFAHWLEPATEVVKGPETN